MRALVLLAGTFAVPVLPVLAASPAFAVDNVICVNNPGGSCDQNVSTIPAAITAANSNNLDDTIRVAAGTYSGVLQIDGSGDALTLEGAGQGVTILTAPANTADTYLFSNGATVKDLTIQMIATTSDGDIGLSLANGAIADHVTVDGSAVTNARAGATGGSTITHSVFLTPPLVGGSTALSSSGNNTISDTSLTGSVGLNLSDPGTTDTVSRVTIRTDGTGVTTDSGTVNIDDSVIDLGTAINSTGIAALNYNAGTADKAVNANHLTIVGGGAGSRGAWAYAAAAAAKQTSTVTLTNSIVRGPATSLVADASNNGAQGGNSTATVTVSYSDYATTGGTIGANGAGGVVLGAGNVTDVDPDFVDAAGGDYRLAPGSPLVDQGDPAPGGPALDLAGAARVVDGDPTPGAVRDMGAYELGDVIPPETTITSGPSGVTGDATPTFAFTSDPGSTFACQVDAGDYVPCASPFTTPSLGNGPHSFTVRATDVATNVEPTPATRAFTVDTAAPESTITKTPAKKVTSKKVKFKFTSAESGVTFQCKREAKAFVPCTSPFRWKVKLGKHVLLVRAVDAAGNVDATPARYRFKRIPKP